ncbi:MAG: MFS transporter [Steroidobacteraceae bacterium]
MVKTSPAWLAVASLSVSTFASVTTEFLPVGLLTNIAAGLSITAGQAGLMVTTPAVVGAFAGPLLIIAARQLDRRIVLLSLSALLFVSNLLAALAPNLMTILVARAMLGLCVGGFWTFAPSATGHLVPEHLQPRAMSYILAGISVAMVAGVPAGAMIGNAFGWRAAFGASSALAAAVLLLQLFVLPSLPPARAIQPRELLVPLTSPAARVGLLVALLLVAGHFAGYTYLRPMLDQIFRLSADSAATLLLVYGAAGFLGTFIGGRLLERSVRGTSMLAALMIAAVLLLSGLAGGGVIAASVATLVWGTAFGLVPVSMTTWMLRALPESPESGQALLVTAFQVAIASGALVGGIVVDASSISGALLLGGGLALLSALLMGIAGGPRAAPPTK